VRSSKSRSEDVNARGAAAKVLYVDDHEELHDIVREFLGTEGYAVISAKNGKQSLEMVRTTRFDLVIVDYEMPGMNGAAVAREIKRLCPEIPIILFSGFASEIPIPELKGVDRLVNKGTLAETLLVEIGRLLSSRKRPPHRADGQVSAKRKRKL
jgi:CheY-like chemotaxis protein